MDTWLLYKFYMNIQVNYIPCEGLYAVCKNAFFWLERSYIHRGWIFATLNMKLIPLRPEGKIFPLCVHRFSLILYSLYIRLP